MIDNRKFASKSIVPLFKTFLIIDTDAIDCGNIIGIEIIMNNDSLALVNRIRSDRNVNVTTRDIKIKFIDK